MLLMRLSWLSVSLRRSSALPLTRLNCQYPLLDTFSFCPKYSSSCLALLMHGHGDYVPCLVLGRYHDCGSLPHVLPVDYTRCPNATLVSVNQGIIPVSRTYAKHVSFQHRSRTMNRGCHWFHTYMQNRHMWADIMNGKLPLMPGAFPQAAPSSAEVDVLATPSHREASIQSSRNRQRT